MNLNSRPARFAVAASFTLPLVLAGCSDDGGDAVASPTSTSSSTTTPTSSTTTPSSTSTTSTTTSSSTSSSSSTTSSSTSSTSSSTSPGSTSSSKSLDGALVVSCISASTSVNGAIRQWNSAVRSGSKSQRDSAARKLGTTAADVRRLAANSKQKGFSTRARTVASELDSMKRAHDAGRSVRPGGLNTSYRTLRTWCSDQIKA